MIIEPVHGKKDAFGQLFESYTQPELINQTKDSVNLFWYITLSIIATGCGVLLITMGFLL